MTVRTLLASVLLLAAGCNNSTTKGDIAEEDFPAAWAASWCARYAECDSAGFAADYVDEAGCEADRSDDAQFNGEWKDLLCGDYNGAGAQDCVDTIDAQQCDDWTNDEWKNECATVYGC